ncbi:MAG TPA: bifunctional demethylmenaquinone methyltransferase/2-methoxy-6-polyprenyl-1,4-benzoquinol methylase UbiE [Marinilabiliaceae bacterium]|nr:bifunctional demethylmenaquinone methyltransferase/2-methoxy-6-polyprenyl-1,4-benzoquinol methylase UbiE [Marinilabiliaceae bacterium]
MSVKPYEKQEDSKKEQVRTMFNRIAPRYDLLNRVLSFGIDRIWRRRLVRLVRKKAAATVLDVATGTGDLALALAATLRKPLTVYGLDISSGMLELARKKVDKKGLQDLIVLKEGDSEDLPFDDNYFDAVTVAFGVRNFGDLAKGLAEMRRVLKPGASLYVLEFSKPSVFPVKQLYGFYFSHILPWWGGVISKDKAAYSYLPASVMDFPEGAAFEAELRRAGLNPTRSRRQTFGIATIYISEKG